MSWLFSQALVEEFSADTCSDGEPSAQLNVMPTPHKFSRQDKTIEPSDLSRFGLTCAVLTEDRGEALLTSYLEASRARTSARQDCAPASTDSDQVCGRNSFAWFAMFDLNSSTWRTPQTSLLEAWEPYSETWPRSGWMVDGTCYLRPTLAPTICVNASGSLLPTLTVNGNYNRPYPGKKSGYGLATAISLLHTLTKAGLNGGSNSRRAREKRGLPPTHIGPLNPTWCEWFMGWPMGWTALEPLETAKFREWQQQHSIFSATESKEAA
jgi:hypothetical protein